MSVRSVLGIDAGGSTCRSRVENEAGDVIFEGRGGPANWASTSPGILRDSLVAALDGCPPVGSVVLCMAGLLTDADCNDVTRLLRLLVKSEAFFARPDYEAVVEAAGPEIDLCVIAGTGSLLCYRDADGVVQKGGGGGPLLGDPGSAFHIVKTCLAPVIARYQGFPSARLAERALVLSGSDGLADLIRRIYRAPSPAAETAALLPAVLADYNDAFPYAVNGVERSFGELAEAISELKNVVPMLQKPLNLGLTGGVFQSGNLVTSFGKVVQAKAGSSVQSVRLIVRTPLEGAVLMARRLANV